MLEEKTFGVVECNLDSQEGRAAYRRAKKQWSLGRLAGRKRAKNGAPP